MSRNLELLRRVEREAGRWEFGIDCEIPRPNASEPSPGTKRSPQLTGQLKLTTLARNEIANMVHRLFLSAEFTTAPQAVVFASVDAPEASSWSTACFAEVLSAHVTGTVCMVDADIRTPLLHAFYGLERGPGVAPGLRGRTPVAQRAHQLSPNLWLISARDASDLPLQSTTLDDAKVVVTELRGAFDYVLINVTPVDQCLDAVLLGGLADGLVLVLEANVTRKAAAQKAKNCLQAAGVKLFGAILNNRQFPIPEALYKRL